MIIYFFSKLVRNSVLGYWFLEEFTQTISCLTQYILFSYECLEYLSAKLLDMTLAKKDFFYSPDLSPHAPRGKWISSQVAQVTQPRLLTGCSFKEFERQVR